MSKDIPTEADFDAAYEYAISKLCTEIPETLGEPGITIWDKVEKKCKVSEKGCRPDKKNPLSQPFFHTNGEKIEYSKNDPIYGKFWERRPPGYYVMRTTDKEPRKIVCAPGNFLMQQWCEYPKTRAEGDVPGVTDVHPFKYKIINGVEYCEITKKYCEESKGVEYINKDCVVPKSQQLLEFWSSTVLVRNAKRKRASDKRLKKNIKLLYSNFPVKGINVYVYEWNGTAHTLYGYSGYDFGFIADELDTKYIINDSHGYKFINLDFDDDNMKKMNIFLKLKEEIFSVYNNNG
jgi:hypothetical protein